MLIKKLFSYSIVLGLMLGANGFVFGGTNPRPLTTSATMYKVRNSDETEKMQNSESQDNQHVKTADQKKNLISKITAVTIAGLGLSLAAIVRSLCYNYPHSFTLKNLLCSSGGILTGVIGAASLAGGMLTAYKINQCTQFSQRDPLNNIPMSTPERVQLIIKTSGIPITWGCLMAYASYSLFKAL